MPKILTDCVRDIETKIKTGKMRKGSSAWGICIDRLRSAGLIKRGRGRHWSLTNKGKKRA